MAFHKGPRSCSSSRNVRTGSTKSLSGHGVGTLQFREAVAQDIPIYLFTFIVDAFQVGLVLDHVSIHLRSVVQVKRYYLVNQRQWQTWKLLGQHLRRVTL